jgi:hypothetical protein
MSLVYIDRLKDTFTTTGTGTLTVANSAPTGSVPTSAVGNGNSSYFFAETADKSVWEVWLGAYTASGTTLSRGTFLASSTGSAIDWAAGTKTLQSDIPAALVALLLRNDLTATLTAGYTATPYDAGTKTTGTFTPDPALGNKQRYINGGAHTLAPQASISDINFEITNNGSAGAVTVSGFDKVVGAFDTTNAHVFDVTSRVGTAKKILYIQGIF